MPVKINILQKGKGIEFVSSGIVTGEEIIEANKKIYTRDYLLPCKYKIIDRSTCTEYRVTPEEMQLIADQDITASKINRDITVVLISSTDLQFGMSRMWQVLSGETGFKSKIFKDRKSAYDFIKEIFSEPNDNDPADK